jgi:hypothetical protein
MHAACVHREDRIVRRFHREIDDERLVILSEGSMQSIGKPFPLIASTLWWSTLTVIAFVYATYINFHLDHSGEEKIFDIMIEGIGFLVTCALLWLLWSYWQGQDWTRTLVMVGLVVKLGWYTVSAYHLRQLPHSMGGKFLFSVRIVDIIFSAYIFFWLLSKEARDYFRSPSTHWESI